MSLTTRREISRAAGIELSHAQAPLPFQSPRGGTASSALFPLLFHEATDRTSVPGP